jgi:hypothetical protein
LGPQKDKYVAAFTIHANNKGNIEHQFHEIRLRVLGIKSQDSLKEWEGREPLLRFPERNFETFNIIPEKMEYYFVRPGVHEKFSAVISIPDNWKFILARASFKYKKTGDLHTTQKVFEVPS